MSNPMSDDLVSLSQRLGYSFNTPDLLLQALTHRSFQAGVNNERLEFLGDAVLSLVVASILLHRYPTASEGNLSQMRAHLVCEPTLAKLASDFKLGHTLRLGLGELKTGGKHRPALLANALEAIIGAIYLDSGLNACKACITRWYAEQFNRITSIPIKKDPKTQLQEYLQSRKMPLPHYALVSQEGVPHEPIFQVMCRIDDINNAVDSLSVIGLGTSRRRAEQKAAESLLDMLAS